MKKFIDMYYVQELVDGAWNDTCVECSYRSARIISKDYRDNGYQARVITRRELNCCSTNRRAVHEYCQDYYVNHKVLPQEMVVLNKNGTIKFSLNKKEMEEILGDTGLNRVLNSTE